MTRYTIIDPTTLPELTVIEVPNTEAILRARMLELKRVWTEYDPPLGAVYDVEGTEFDPLKINQEVNTNFEMLLMNRINMAARGVTLAYARGGDIDTIASRYPGGVPRLPGEADDRYIRRILLSPATLTPHGVEESYVFWAMTSNPAIKDATSVTVEGTGEITITLLMDRPEPRPTADELLLTRRYLHDLGRKSATDTVTIAGPQVQETAIRARVWLFPGPDATTVMQTLDARLRAYIEGNRWLGADVTHNAIHAALNLPSVQNVVIEEPAASIFAGPRQFIKVTNVTLELAGRAT